MFLPYLSSSNDHILNLLEGLEFGFRVYMQIDGGAIDNT
jgi:hypothetical protein